MSALVNVIYNRWSDNLAQTATLVEVSGGSAASGYSVEWIRDVNAGRPFKWNELQGGIVFGWAAPVTVTLPAIFHANFQVGLNVRIQAKNTNSAWNSPTFEAAFTIPAWRADRFPGQPWLDLTGLPSWGAYSYWRLAILADNAVTLSVGDLWLGAVVRRLSPNIQWGPESGYDRPQVEHQTAFRRLRSPLGTTRRVLEGDLRTSAAGAQDVFDWHLDANGRPTLLIPDGTKNEAWLAINTTPLQKMREQFLNDNTLHLTFEEDGRGLEPTPSPLP